MAKRNPPPHDETQGRTPATNDIDPDGMDPETESDELDTGAGDEGIDDDVEPDGFRDDRRSDTAKH